MGTNCTDSLSKERLKWTKELHALFVKAVNQIGGPDKATPKGILKAMAIPGLTIFHVKSHLQKYRISVFTQEEDYTKGKLERRSVSEMLSNFCDLPGAKLNKALLIQMEAQRRLSDQLEIHQSMKMKIEAQGRFLDKIMEEYKNLAPEKLIEPYSAILSLPSLSEELDLSSGKKFKSDAEEVNDISSKEEFRAQKRIKIQDENVMQQIIRGPSFDLDSQKSGLFYLEAISKNLYAEQEIGLPWTVNAASSSWPLLPAMYDHLHQ